MYIDNDNSMILYIYTKTLKQNNIEKTLIRYSSR